MITIDKLTASYLLVLNADLFFGNPDWNNVCHQFTWRCPVDEKKLGLGVIWVAVYELVNSKVFDISFRDRQSYLDRSTAWVNSVNEDMADHLPKGSVECILVNIALSLDETVRSLDRVIFDALSQRGLVDPDRYIIDMALRGLFDRQIIDAESLEVSGHRYQVGPYRAFVEIPDSREAVDKVSSLLEDPSGNHADLKDWVREAYKYASSKPSQTRLDL